MYSGNVPPDPVIAVSDNYVLQAVNSNLGYKMVERKCWHYARFLIG